MSQMQIHSTPSNCFHFFYDPPHSGRRVYSHASGQALWKGMAGLWNEFSPLFISDPPPPPLPHKRQLVERQTVQINTKVSTIFVYGKEGYLFIVRVRYFPSLCTYSHSRTINTVMSCGKMERDYRGRGLRNFKCEYCTLNAP